MLFQEYNSKICSLTMTVSFHRGAQPVGFDWQGAVVVMEVFRLNKFETDLLSRYQTHTLSHIHALNLSPTRIQGVCPLSCQGGGKETGVHAIKCELVINIDQETNVWQK